MITIKTKQRTKSKKKRVFLNLTKQQQKLVGFKYDYDLKEYIYKFPVYRAKDSGKATLFCKLGINDETNEVWTDVFSTTGQLYTSYYRREGVKSDVIKKVDKNIKKELDKLIKICRGDKK